MRYTGFGAVRDILIFIAVLWVAFLLESIFPLRNFGIQPRHLHGLIGILAAPLIHANTAHIAANSIGLLVFGLFCGILEGERVFGVIAWVMVIGGLLTWLFARPANHMGASGIIFGLFGYLIFLGFFNHRWYFIAASIICLIGFGSTIYGILPRYPSVSWEGHLFGFLSGALAAKWRSRFRTDGSNGSRVS